MNSLRKSQLNCFFLLLTLQPRTELFPGFPSIGKLPSSQVIFQTSQGWCRRRWWCMHSKFQEYAIRIQGRKPRRRSRRWPFNRLLVKPFPPSDSRGAGVSVCNCEQCVGIPRTTVVSVFRASAFLGDLS